MLIPRSLKTEYAVRPLGVDVPRPRCSWVAEAPGYGATQTAYQLLVASAPELLTPEDADVWDSDKVESPRTFGIEYGGPTAARTRYHWTVRLWDGLGQSLGDAVRDLTQGRGADAVIDAVGMEAHGSPVGTVLHRTIAMLPKAVAAPMMQKAGVDKMAALYSAIDAVRRGGTVSVSGVYGGAADPMPMLTLFDKQIQLRMGQANVKRWADDIMELLGDDDPLGVEEFATHRLPLDEAARAYAMFQAKEDGAVKVVFTP